MAGGAAVGTAVSVNRSLHRMLDPDLGRPVLALAVPTSFDGKSEWSGCLGRLAERARAIFPAGGEGSPARVADGAASARGVWYRNGPIPFSIGYKY